MNAVTSTARAPGEASPGCTQPSGERAPGANDGGCASVATCAAEQSWQCEASAALAWPCAISTVIKTIRIKHRTPTITLPVLDVDFIRNASRAGYEHSA